ncbi:MAG: flagellar hook-associated protein FlgK [Ruminococcus flavefaciens]|nr:flagellar hook-associated protein FlgK [Ruminococcus flavefaciens]
MSLMGSLYIGASGLQTSNNALNTTAHNMSNIDTTGYVRQQVQQGTRIYKTISTSGASISYTQTGLGVNYINVKQVRDQFLDKNYRRESGRSAFYDTWTATVEEVEDLFQELEGEAFGDSIENLWKSIQELSKHPENSVNQGAFVQRCNEFISRAKAVYTGLCEYQDNLNYKIAREVDTMNAYAERISELNKEILKIESGKVERANDLRDERNQLIDELSAMANIDCKEDVFGNAIIKLEGYQFVKDDSYNKIELFAEPDTGFYTPFWSHLVEHDETGKLMVNSLDDIKKASAEVFRMDQEISTATNTDIGSLKAMMFARGDHRATYEDLDPDIYDSKTSQSILMNVQAEFDQLINKVTVGINQIFADAAAKATAEQGAGSTYMRDTNITNPDGTHPAYKIFDTITGSPTFTIDNLTINSVIKQAPSLLGMVKEDGKIDQETADALKAIFEKSEIVKRDADGNPIQKKDAANNLVYDENGKPVYETDPLTLNPNVKTATNFINYYNNLIIQVGNTGDVLRGISENQQITVDNTYAAREQVHGVSSDEELSNMIMFQNAYNASSRYINVISELLEHIINTMGR